MRKIIASLAVSADGYIARPDGDVEWLNRLPDTIDHGMGEFFKTIDTTVLGRKTHDWGLQYSRTHTMSGSMFDSRLANYVFSRHPPGEVMPNVQFSSESVETFTKRMRAMPGKNIWMMGGGDLIASFLDAGEIDEFDMHVIPVFIGEGIPLIAPRHRDLPLRLLECTPYEDGVVRLRYSTRQ